MFLNVFVFNPLDTVTRRGFAFDFSLIEFNYIKSKLNSIEFKSHAMSINIFFQMELNFHKINSFFLIRSSSLILCIVFFVFFCFGKKITSNSCLSTRVVELFTGWNDLEIQLVKKTFYE